LLGQPESYKSQIDAMVRGFMQVWVKFEAMLPGELARVQGILEGMSPGEMPFRDREYELFFRVSSILSQEQSMTMGELSAALSVPLSKATRTADWLVAHDFVRRTADREDRRVVRLTLTANGLMLHRLIEEQYPRARRGNPGVPVSRREGIAF
jgi:hypothetical protein